MLQGRNPENLTGIYIITNRCYGRGYRKSHKTSPLEHCLADLTQRPCYLLIFKLFQLC